MTLPYERHGAVAGRLVRLRRLALSMLCVASVTLHHTPPACF